MQCSTFWKVANSSTGSNATPPHQATRGKERNTKLGQTAVVARDERELQSPRNKAPKSTPLHSMIHRCLLLMPYYILHAHALMPTCMLSDSGALGNWNRHHHHHHHHATATSFLAGVFSCMRKRSNWNSIPNGSTHPHTTTTTVPSKVCVSM